MIEQLEKAIAVLSPTWALDRAEKRHRLRKYDAASHSPRTKSWRATNASQNAETYRDLDTLRARMRDLVRNNGWAKRALRVWTSNVVGTGIRPQPVIRMRGGKRNTVEEQRVLDLWNAWGVDSTQCDVDGQNNIYGLQRLVQRETVEAGEVMVRRWPRSQRDRLAVPLQLQVLEADHLDSTLDGPTRNGGRIVQGIEFDSRLRRVAYHLFPEHPGESTFASFRSMTSVRVPAEQILHIYDPLRAGQVRGVPWGAPSMLTLKDFEEFGDAEIVRAKIAASFVGFVHDMEVPGDLDEDDDDDDGNLVMAPGTWEELPPGKDIKFSDPPEPGKFADFAKVTLQQIASGWDVPYESLTNDLSNVNFSSGRLGRLEFNGAVDEWQLLGLQPRFLSPLWGWFVQFARLGNAMKADPAVEWTYPAKRMVEPAREVKAMIDQIAAGLMSHSEALRRLGKDPRRMLEELSADQAFAEELGLKLPILQALKGAADEGKGGEGDTGIKRDPK